MSLITLQYAQMLGVLRGYQAQGSVYSNRNSVASFSGGIANEVAIQQGNFNASYASKMQESAMNKSKNIIKNNLSGFNTFA